MKIFNLFKRNKNNQLLLNWSREIIDIIESNERLKKDANGISDGELIINNFLKNGEFGLAFEHLIYIVNEAGLYLNKPQEKALISYANQNNFHQPKFLVPSESDTIEFYRILKKFNDSQEAVVNKLIELWSIQTPMKTMDWVVWSQNQFAQDEFKNDYGIRIFPHGFGLSYQSSEFYIDFDFGENGETNGFDYHRLWCFIEKNEIETYLINEYQIEKIIEAQTSKGKLEFSGYINYYQKIELQH